MVGLTETWGGRMVGSRNQIDVRGSDYGCEV